MNTWIVRLKKTYRLLPPLLARDIKERYAGSVLGVFWTFIQPVLFMLVFWLVFSQIIKVRISVDSGEIPYLAFLLSGLLPWFALQEGIIRGASSLVEKGFIIKKVFYPPELFPISAVLSSFIHHGTGLFIFLVIFFIYKGGISLFQLPAVALLLFLQLMLTIGFSFFLSALSVYVRDILQVLGVIFQALLYLTTILYPISSVPKGLRFIVDLNPFTWLIEGYHSVILYGRYPEISSLLYLSIFAAVVFFLGIVIFRRLKGGFADVL